MQLTSDSISVILKKELPTLLTAIHKSINKQKLSQVENDMLLTNLATHIFAHCVAISAAGYAIDTENMINKLLPEIISHVDRLKKMHEEKLSEVKVAI